MAKLVLSLAKSKHLERTTDIVSSLVPQSIVIVLIITFMLFLNLVALWLGESLETILGFLWLLRLYSGGIVIHFFMLMERGSSEIISSNVCLNKNIC